MELNIKKENMTSKKKLINEKIKISGWNKLISLVYV